MADDYIPRPDPEFLAWTQTFVAYLNANLLLLGLTATDVAPITTALTAFTGGYNANLTAQNAAQSTAENKDLLRVALEDPTRELAQQLQVSPTVTDPQREGMGLNVRDTTRTKTPVPTTHPVAEISTAEKLQHRIRFRDSLAEGASRAKPEGVLGAEIWHKIGGAPPVDYTECEFLALDTNSPYTAVYTGADTGKTVYYLLRWLNTTGEKGPWSPLVQATVTN